jgi:hypothetical protein
LCSIHLVPTKNARQNLGRSYRKAEKLSRSQKIEHTFGEKPLFVEDGNGVEEKQGRCVQVSEGQAHFAKPGFVVVLCVHTTWKNQTN